METRRCLPLSNLSYGVVQQKYNNYYNYYRYGTLCFLNCRTVGPEISTLEISNDPQSFKYKNISFLFFD